MFMTMAITIILIIIIVTSISTVTTRNSNAMNSNMLVGILMPIAAPVIAILNIIYASIALGVVASRCPFGTCTATAAADVVMASFVMHLFRCLATVNITPQI